VSEAVGHWRQGRLLTAAYKRMGLPAPGYNEDGTLSPVVRDSL